MILGLTENKGQSEFQVNSILVFNAIKSVSC